MQQKAFGGRGLFPESMGQFTTLPQTHQLDLREGKGGERQEGRKLRKKKKEAEAQRQGEGRERGWREKERERKGKRKGRG